MLHILSGGRLNFGGGRGIIPKPSEGFRTNLCERRARFYEGCIDVGVARNRKPLT
jgi:hypothetical protein